MAVSLGVRISGLFVIGAVAVAAAAFGTDGSDAARGGDSRSTSVSPAPSSSGALDDGEIGTATSTAPPRTPGHTDSGAPKGSGGNEVPGASESPAASRTPVASPTPSGTGPGGGTKVLTVPDWLPPGPVSPDTDGAPDPAAVYDELRAPDRCAAALKMIPAGTADSPASDDWRVLRGLAAACLAVQGRGGDWGVAAAGHTGPADKALTCKGRAARQILGGLLDFHRRHPAATVRLETPSAGQAACGYGIGAVDVGGDGEAAPGDTVSIELRGTYFDHAGLLRDGNVFIGGRPVAGPPVLVSESGDRLVLSAVVPGPGPGPGPSAGTGAGVGAGVGAAASAGPVDVLVRYRTAEAAKKDAFLLVPPEPAKPPEPSPGIGTGTGTGTGIASRAPERMLAVRPLLDHRAGPEAPAGLRVAQGHADVAGQDDTEGERQPVVDEGRAGAPHQRGEVGEPHEQARAEHDQGRARDPGRVDLLARVELGRRACGAALVTS